MMNRLRFVSKAEQFQAWSDLADWGYPFARSDYADEVAMVCIGDGKAWAWFEWATHDVVLVHLGASPVVRGRWFTRHVMDGIRWSAELMGARRIYATVEKCPHMVTYLERLGWHKDTIGYYLEV